MALSTVSKEEISHFNQLAATWWDENGPMWPLHLLNQIRLPFVLDKCREHFGQLEQLSFLDIGCGGGLLSESIAKTGADVSGIDAAERNINIAQSHASGQNLKLNYQHVSLEEWQEDHQFDVVLNMEVVEHVDNLEWFMEMACKRTKPGGLMFLATINRTLFSALTAKFAAEYVLCLLPVGTHQWSKFVTPGEIAQMLEENGFETGAPVGVSVNPFFRKMKIIGYTGANYMLVAQKQ
jgi:2-polyprenyl-6-hydroxyphenyl methylase/3-demethylubiquinone-9 3-methyltransferase